MAELRQEEIQAVIRRATEIEGLNHSLAVTDTEVAAFVAAADEVGISRDATLQALRERLNYRPETYKVGQQIFAESGDGRMYPAKIVALHDSRVEVRFANGSDGSASFAQIRPFTLGPGEKLEYNSPTFYSWITGDVVRVNLDGGSVTVTYATIEETLPLERIRMAKPKADTGLADRAALITVGLTSGFGGLVLGALITWFLRR